MDKKKNQTYTVMIIPNPTSKTYRFSIGRSAVKRLVAAGTVLSILLVVFIVHYALMNGKMLELSSLRQETKSQKVQIQAYAQTIADIKQQMARLKEFDAKLRVITDLDVPNENKQVMGMGGTQEPSIEELLDATEPNQGALARGIERDLSILKGAVSRQEVSFQELAEAVKGKQTMWASTPSIWPVRGWMTSGFGKRVSPFTGTVSMHKGIDVATRMGTPVVAPAAGIVSYTGYHNGLGKMLRINHGYGIQTVYGHLSKFGAKPGRRVKRGDVIAYVGNTGLSTGPHLHYEVLVNRVPVNPTKYILN